MALADKLTHSIDITSVGALDANGQPTAGTTQTEVPCFIDGRSRRTVDSTKETWILTYSILFGPDAEVRVGDTIASGYDKGGNILIESGRIVEVEDSHHPKKGLMVREAWIARN